MEEEEKEEEKTGKGRLRRRVACAAKCRESSTTGMPRMKSPGLTEEMSTIRLPSVKTQVLPFWCSQLKKGA